MKSYILSIIAAAIVCAIINGFLDAKSAPCKIAKLLSGIFMAVTLISPLAKFSISNFSDYLDGLSLNADKYTEEGREKAQLEIDRIIKSKTEAYILDKANSMDLKITVEVELDERNDSIPCEVRITGKISPYAKEVLSSYIQENLGIAKENQKWI